MSADIALACRRSPIRAGPTGRASALPVLGNTCRYCRPCRVPAHPHRWVAPHSISRGQDNGSTDPSRTHPTRASPRNLSSHPHRATSSVRRRPMSLETKRDYLQGALSGRDFLRRTQAGLKLHRQFEPKTLRWGIPAPHPRQAGRISGRVFWMRLARTC